MLVSRAVNKVYFKENTTGWHVDVVSISMYAVYCLYDFEHEPYYVTLTAFMAENTL